MARQSRLDAPGVLFRVPRDYHQGKERRKIFDYKYDRKNSLGENEISVFGKNGKKAGCKADQGCI